MISFLVAKVFNHHDTATFNISLDFWESLQTLKVKFRSCYYAVLYLCISFEDPKVFALIWFDIVLHESIERDDLVFPTDIDLMDKENLLPCTKAIALIDFRASADVLTISK